MSRIITAHELSGRSLAALQALYRSTHEELVRSAEGSAARRNALASLENISRAMVVAWIGSPGPR